MSSSESDFNLSDLSDSDDKFLFSEKLFEDLRFYLCLLKHEVFINTQADVTVSSFACFLQVIIYLSL